MSLRVLITTDAVGGVWQYTLELAAALETRGAAPILALLGPAPSVAQRDALAAAGGFSLIETGLPLDWLSDGPAQVRAAGQALIDLALRERADVAQLNAPALVGPESWPLPAIAVAHGCISTWWEAARPGQPLDPTLSWHRLLMKQGLGAADMVVAPSASHAVTIARHYALERPPEVVRNGRTPLPLREAPMHDCVLTVGRLWDPVKRAVMLDCVADRLAVPFHAAGPIRRPHGETVTLHRLHLLGSLDEPALAERLACRPVFVSAASFEPFGLAVLEAAQAGCALVLSNIPTFVELWDGAALFVEDDDEAGYVHAIESLIGDIGLRERLGEAARERARRYTPAATAGAMLTLYRRAIAARSAHRVAA